MAPAGTGCVLAFDYGTRHIGVAVGQTVSNTANPLTTLKARQGKPDWLEVMALIEQWQPLLLIVGLPLNMDDTESAMSERARSFARRLTVNSGLETVLVDERLTSREVRHLHHHGSHHGGHQGNTSHALAAVLIAESWLQGFAAKRTPG